MIFKHCFPGAGIGPDTRTPDITSNRKSLENYQLQYRALRELMDGMPDKKFMVWTLVPLHRLATTADQATRAYEFVKWVKNEWLTEDSLKHPNIFIFDFFSLVAEMDANPTNGKQYCLKYDYEANHASNDSHPNVLANQTIGPIFAQEVIKALSSYYNISEILVSSQTGENTISTDHGTLQMQTTILPEDAKSKSVSWSVINQTGKASVDSLGLLRAEANGTVKVIATAKDASEVKGELQINISNQLILVESILINDNLNNDTIIGLNTKISLQASIIPPDATNQSVEWRIENISGEASIDENGTLITFISGKIKVIAKAIDSSGTIGFKEYLIINTVINPKVLNSNQIRIYPNPARDRIKIELDNVTWDGVILEIRNVAGQILMKKKVISNLTEWSLPENPSNIYLVTIFERSKATTCKIVKCQLID